jgi:hypothetical protein
LGLFDDEIEVCRVGGKGKKQEKKPEHGRDGALEGKACQARSGLAWLATS